MALVTSTSDYLLNPVDVLSHFMKHVPGLFLRVKEMGGSALIPLVKSCPELPYIPNDGSQTV